MARLIATGRSNRQTAAELYVSVKTVEVRIGHIFGKPGIRSAMTSSPASERRRLTLEET